MKNDVIFRSFGVVLWELLTCETPYRDVDQAAIIYGVGTNTLHLPVPPTVPSGFLLLMKICWDPKPRCRPSFASILLHLSIAASDLIKLDPEHYTATQLQWKKDVRSRFSYISHSASNASDTSSVSGRDLRQETVDFSNDNNNSRSNNNNSSRQQNRFDDSRSGEEGSDQVLRRLAEMRHVNDIRALYEEKLEKVNTLYAEMASLKAILEEQTKNKSK